MPLTRLLLRLLPFAAALGLVVGAARARDLWTAGYPLLLADAARRDLRVALVAAVVLAVLLTLAAALIDRVLRRLGELSRVALAVLLAGAPLLAAVGYGWNRARAVRPSELLSWRGIEANLPLLAAAALVGVVVVALALGARRRDEPGEGRPWWIATAAALVVLIALEAGLAWAFQTSRKDPDRPDILILLVDALRADHLSAYGHSRQTTPAIDSLARDGVLFAQTISQSTFTKTSVASLFTGRYPHQHGVYWGSHQGADGQITSDLLRGDETTLAEALRERGYLTSAWVQNSHRREVMGVGQGFVEYHDQQGHIERIHDRFLAWARGAGRRYSFFTYLHYIDLHDPYRPPPPYDTLFAQGADAATPDVYADVDFAEWGAYLEDVRQGRVELSGADVRRLEELYDGQLRAIDDQIGVLLHHLQELGLYDDTLIVLTADHGDGFLEHGFISHSTTPYEELVRVPLILKFPRGKYRGRTVERQVRLVDLMPTLLELAGAPVDRLIAKLELPGCSLLGELEGAAPAARCGVAVSEIAEDEGAPPTIAVRTERFKWIERGAGELYALDVDPEERSDLSQTPPAEALPLAELARSLTERRDAEGERLELDEEMIRELKALGYIE